MKYQYSANVFKVKELEKGLNDLGAYGWRAVYFEYVPDQKSYYVITEKVISE